MDKVMVMRRPSGAWLAAVGALAVLAVQAGAPPARGQDLKIYPADGQSHARQSKDHSACHSRAVRETGFDPYVAQPPPNKSGGVLKGGLLGGGVGAIGGAIGGNAGAGAAAGAVVGGIVGGVRQHKQNAAVDEQRAEYLRGYNHALAVCMRNKGYTVG